jgi:hypothetical protein
MSLAGCGGGGSGGGDSSTQNANPPTTTVSPNTIATAGPNVQPISVDLGPANIVNGLFTSVTLCAPGSSTNCQTIDHVLVDIGSSGLRVLSSVLSSSLVLGQQTDTTGNSIAECAQFADGYSWGPVKVADIKIAGESANSVPIQVIGDPSFATVPTNCSRTGPAKNTVLTLAANGILGMGVFRRDCGSACALSSSPGFYFACPTSGCHPTALGLAQQLQNPVAMFAVDNNGVIIELPAVSPAGAVSVSGSLVFGIGTQANNGLGTASVFSVDANLGTFTTQLNGQTFPASFIDSGSNALFFQDSGTQICASLAGFFCPSTTQNLSATIQGTNGATANVAFSVANAEVLLTNNPTFRVFSNLAGSQITRNSFDWGLPFFFGRNVFIAIEGANTPAAVGPYLAF